MNYGEIISADPDSIIDPEVLASKLYELRNDEEFKDAISVDVDLLADAINIYLNDGSMEEFVEFIVTCSNDANAETFNVKEEIAQGPNGEERQLKPEEEVVGDERHTGRFIVIGKKTEYNGLKAVKMAFEKLGIPIPDEAEVERLYKLKMRERKSV